MKVFYNMSLILQNLSSEGFDVSDDIISSLTPYMTSHIIRFGQYTIDKNIKIPELRFDIRLKSKTNC